MSTLYHSQCLQKVPTSKRLNIPLQDSKLVLHATKNGEDENDLKLNFALVLEAKQLMYKTSSTEYW